MQTLTAVPGSDASRELEALLEEHVPRLHAYIRLRSGPLIRRRESTSDLVQSVCREALESLGRFEYRGAAQFRAWLFTAAARKIADRVQYYQAERRSPDREAPLDAGPTSDKAIAEVSAAYARYLTPSRAFHEQEAAHRIEAAFARLPEEKREVILMARIAGWTSAEIAQKTGETDVAIRARLRRALAELAMHLDAPRKG